MSVNYDVVLHVLHFIYDDSLFEILAQCASVNQEFCRAALCYLYRRVTISPRSDAAKPQLDLSRRNQKLVSDLWRLHSLLRRFLFFLVLEWPLRIRPFATQRLFRYRVSNRRCVVSCINRLPPSHATISFP